MKRMVLVPGSGVRGWGLEVVSGSAAPKGITVTSRDTSSRISSAVWFDIAVTASALLIAQRTNGLNIGNRLFTQRSSTP